MLLTYSIIFIFHCGGRMILHGVLDGNTTNNPQLGRTNDERNMNERKYIYNSFTNEKSVHEGKL